MDGKIRGLESCILLGKARTGALDTVVLPAAGQSRKPRKPSEGCEGDGYEDG